MTAGEAYLNLVRTSYTAYCHHVHEGRWKAGRAASLLCREVESFINGPPPKAYEILVLSMPPQHGKSMTVTETLPSYYLCRNPDRRVIAVSYSEDFAQLFGRRNRDKIERFGHLFNRGVKRSPSSAVEFEMEGHFGGMISRGILSGVTGRACDLMIIDDPIKTRQEADSPVIRERIFDEWENSFKTRLSAGGRVVLIQTRWHEDDLCGRILKSEPNVRLLNLPCEAEENDPLGRGVGEPLCPELGKDEGWLNSFKASYTSRSGSRAWNALFQGRPSFSEGGMLKREWWRYYDAPPARLDETIISVDAAFKDGSRNDYVAIQCWGRAGERIYLLDGLKARLNFPDTLRAIREMKGRWPAASHILIEDKANGPAVVAVLRREMAGVIGVNPQGGKAARVNAVSGAIESANVYLPKNAPFTGDFVEECAAFPNGAHDDQVDAMSQALNRFIYRTGRPDMPFGTTPDPFGLFKMENRAGGGREERMEII